MGLDNQSDLAGLLPTDGCAARHRLVAGRWLLAVCRGLRSLAAGCWSPVAGLRTLVADRWLLIADRSSLAASRWLLVAGRWPLVAGRRALAAGRWPLISVVLPSALGAGSRVVPRGGLAAGACGVPPFDPR